MGRILSIIWILATLVVNVFALTALLHGFGFADTEWRQPFYGLGQIYASLADKGFSGAANILDDRFGFALPWWAAHMFVIYAASASAIAASGIGVARRESFLAGAASGGLSLAWPLAILAFIWKAIRLKIVSRFARDHSLALLVYALAVAGAYGGATYVNAHYLDAQTPKPNNELILLDAQGETGEWIDPARYGLAHIEASNFDEEIKAAWRRVALKPYGLIAHKINQHPLLISSASEPYFIALSGSNAIEFIDPDGKITNLQADLSLAQQSPLLIEVQSKSLNRSRFTELVQLTEQIIQLTNEGKYSDATNLAQRALVLAEQTFGSEAPVTLSFITVLAQLYVYQGRYAEAEPLYERALAGQESALGPEHKQTLTTLHNLAFVYKSLGKYAEAEALYKRALSVQERVLGSDNPDTLTTATNLGALYVSAGRYKEAELLLKSTLTTSERVLGAEHPITLTTTNNLALLYSIQGRYNEAALLHQRTLTLLERTLGPEHPYTLTSINNLANVYLSQGHYLEAERLIQRSLTVHERVLGPDHPQTLSAVSNLGSVFSAQGRYAESEVLFVRALETRTRTLGPDHPDTLNSANNLAALYSNQARYAEAEPLYQQALAGLERTLGPNHPDTLRSVGNLGALYFKQGRYDEAEPLYRRAADGRMQILGPEYPDTLISLNNLAFLYQDQGRYAEAETLYLRVIEARTRVLGPNHPDTLISLNNIAMLYRAQARYAEAAPLLIRSLKATSRILGPNHPSTLISANNLATLYQDQGRYTKAETLFVQVLKARTRTLGPDHPNTLSTVNNLAVLNSARGRHREAASLYARAIRGYAEGFFSKAQPTQSRDRARANTVQTLTLPNIHLFTKKAPQTSGTSFSDLASAVLSTGQLLKDSSVGADIARGASRLGKRSPVLQALIDQYGEVLVKRGSLRAELSFQVNLPQQKQDQTRMSRLRSDITAAEQRLRAIESDIRARFPDYAALSIPQGLEADAVAAVLEKGEALVAYTSAGKEGELLAVVVTPDGKASIVALAPTEEELTEAINRLRAGVELPSGGSLTAADLQSLSFDMDAAAALYDDLFRPLEPFIGDARHIIIAPDGPLESLPFNLLVRAKADHPDPADVFDRYRQAEWLIDRYTVSITPTVSALAALRNKKRARATKALIGFGNPTLEGKKGGRKQAAAKDIGLITLGGSDTTNIQAVREFEPVPQTERALKAIASALGAPSSDLYLGARASEAQLMSLNTNDNLSRYRVVAFATHALIAGELDAIGLDEPALVMTPPANDNNLKAENDGLLRASEVVGLTLDADWVLLTACNTAAGDGTLGAEPLSGLAKSFFYAGARSLLVSHWPAEANATARLAPAMIKAHQNGATKAQALQTAMRDMKADLSCPAGQRKRTTCPENAHPALWGTFAIIGEGR